MGGRKKTQEKRPLDVPEFTDENPPTGATLGYWKQRHRLFSRYEEGIWLTLDAWYEVTPESIAAKIATHILQPGITTIIDAFCGVGGNSIQFALSPLCTRVIAIDTNPSAIRCARHNARVYGVLDKIVFVEGDFFKLLDEEDSRLTGEAVFLSPPWGGPGYRNEEVFDLESMLPYSASYIVTQASRITPNLALYIPRTSDLNQVAAMVPEGQTEKLQAIHYCTQRRSKALTVYFGALSREGMLEEAEAEGGEQQEGEDVEMEYYY